MSDSETISLLVVEDVSIIRDLVKLTFANCDHVRVIGEATNGQEAVEMADELKPDIILMDIEMPMMDGIEASKIIHQKHKNIKIIMLTASSDETQICKSFAAGAEGYILKERFQETVEVAISTVRLGAVWLDPSIGRLILEAANASTKKQDGASISELLTAEERQILNEVADCSGDRCLVDPEFVLKLHKLTLPKPVNESG